MAFSPASAIFYTGVVGWCFENNKKNRCQKKTGVRLQFLEAMAFKFEISLETEV